MAFTIKGLVSDGTLPASAQADIAAAISNTSSTVRQALNNAGLGQGGASDADIAALAQDPGTSTSAALSRAINTGITTSGVVDQLYAAANPAPATDIPSVTIAQGNTAPITGVEEPYNTGKVRTVGVQPGPVDYLGRTYRENRAAGTQSGGGARPYTFEFITSDAEVAFKIGAQSAGPKVWVWVDGRPVGFAPQKFTATIGEPYWVRLNFPNAKVRTIRVGMDTAAFGGLISASGVTAPGATEQIRAALVGDSWFAGGTNLEGGWPYTMSHLAGRLLGWGTLNASIGGTGYVNGNNYGLQSRVDQVVAFAPHYIVVWGSINDVSHPAAAVQTAAANLYAAYASALPNTRVIVVGPQPAPAGTAYTTATALRATRDAVRTAALAAPNVLGFIDPIAGRWVTGTGSVTNPAGDGNADYYMASDKIHPSPLGGSYFARRMVEDIVRVLASKGINWQVWDGVTIPNPNSPTPPALPPIFADDFERTSTNIIGENTPTGNKTWAALGTGTVPITGGVATISASADYLAYVNGGVSDGTLTATVATVGPGGTAPGVLFRMSDLNNYHQIRVNGGVWQIIKRVAGSVSVVNANLGPATDGDALAVVLAGSSIAVRLNGADVFTGTDTDLQTATMYGMRGNSTAVIGLGAIQLVA